MSLLTVLAIIRWARKQQPGFGAAAKNVLNVIATYADPQGVCHPGQDELAAATGYGERAVRLALSRLEAAGYLTRQARYRRDGSRTTDEIRLRLDRPQEQDGDGANRNPIPVVEPATTGTKSRHHRNLIPLLPESDSGPTTFEHTSEQAIEHSEPKGSAPVPGADPNFKNDLWIRSTGILRRLTDLPERRCRAVIGSWRALVKDDATVIRAIDEAESEQVLEAVSWIEARLRRGNRPGGRSTAPATTPVTSAAAAERQAQAQAMVDRGQWPSGGTVFVAADSAAGDAWAAYFARFGVKPRWVDQGRSGRGWLMPSELPPIPPPTAIAA